MLETTNQMEIRALQQELSTMRIKYTELEMSHSTMMEMVEKLSRPGRNSTLHGQRTGRKHPSIRKHQAKKPMIHQIPGDHVRTTPVLRKDGGTPYRSSNFLTRLMNSF
ncbi:hypothetical protein KC19_VG039800 [Ceratodon purpureus]|uniref:Uncharacterized protein n=1 Tax=Ceratodon purpureus TaxID=3225 RepID=A0A8T0HLR4_CERPU|nr:hypothetical protein KC19_VG039800 [Ceratodon purpureus]